MKKILFLLGAIALFGAGCFSTPPASTSTGQTPEPVSQMGYVGCTPKALTVLQPSANAAVSLPLTVKIRIENRSQPNCHWTVFEAQAGTMRLVDVAGATVGTGILMTSDDWMTDGPVEFTGEIPALSRVDGAVTLILTEENPSGEGTPQEVSIPLTIQP